MPQSVHQPISQPQSDIQNTSTAHNAQMGSHGKLKQILDKQIAAAGKAVYRVLWEDGTETEVRPKVLVLSYPEVIEEFESHRLGRHRQSLYQLKSSRTPKKQKVYQSDSRSPIPSKPTHIRITTRKSKKSLAQVKPSKPQTRLTISKPRSHWRPYTKSKFVRQHWSTCSKCNQPGCTGLISRPKKRKKQSPVQPSKLRLYLCNLCSASTHAECLPSDPLALSNHFSSTVIKGTREFTFHCHLCLAEQSMAPQIISSICEGCHTITQSDIHWQSTSDTNSINNHNNNTNNPTTDDENEDEGEDEDEDKNEDQDQDEDQDEDEDKEENEDKGEDEDEDEDEDKDKAKDKANANTKKLILSQNEEYLTFRCSQCKCNYHYNCLPCFPDALSRFNELPGKEIVEEMCLAEWKCAYCITYDKKIESVITWRPMRTNLGTPAQGYQPNKTQFREFLVKWKTMSFRHLTWVPATWLARVEPSLYRDACKFDFVRPPLSEQTLVPRSWMMIESILDIEHFQIQGRYVISRVFAKFCNLPYDEACWDTPPPDYSDLYPAYRRALYQWERVRRIKTPHDLEKRILAIRSVQTDKDFPNHQLKIEPDYITGGRLLKHQLGDINWLLQQWLLNKLYVHVDNSGFGKTIQTIIFLYHLFKKFDIYPFAIVVSESSLTKWLDAFKKWAPDLSVAGYYGSEASCRTASEYEIFRTGSSASASASASSSVGAGAGAGAAQGGRSGIKCHAVLFTHKSLTSDPAEIISRVDYWAACVIDESQQLIDFTNHEKPTFNITRCNQYITIVGTSLESHARKLSIQSS